MNLQLPPNLATETPKTHSGKAADVQITSAEILQHAHQLKANPYKASKQTIQDLEELHLFQLAKRREYEQHLNKNRLNYGQWLRYAKWELDHNHDFKRFRSIMERALAVNVQHIPFWVRYVEMELLHRNINHARNLLDRAVTTLPYTDKLWYVYVQTEEALGNYSSARSIFERWVSWVPAKSVWQSYIGFEKRYDEYDNVRALYARFLAQFPEGEVWLQWANFERLEVTLTEDLVSRVRGVFEAALDNMAENGTLGTDKHIPQIVLQWSSWEASLGEIERARKIFFTMFNSGIPQLDEQKAKVYQVYTDFERMHGTENLIDHSVIAKRKAQLELELFRDPNNYLAWWDYLKLEEKSSPETLRPLFQRSVSNVPRDKYKLLQWRRYVFLWIKFALWEEFNNKKIDYARKCWNDALAVIPHVHFTFAKIWIMAAEFELRHDKKDGLILARKRLGKAIGYSSVVSSKNKIFKYYIELETKLNELDRVRSLYTKWIETALLFEAPTSSGHSALDILLELCDKEAELGEQERCIALYDLALSMPNRTQTTLNENFSFEPRERLLESYITFLKDEFLYDDARKVYRRELTENGNAFLWIQLALFELSILSPAQLDLLDSSEDVEFKLEDYQKSKTREVFGEAVRHFREMNDAPNCIIVLDSWKDYEKAHGDSETLAQVEKRYPTEVTKRTLGENGEEISVEYEFPKEAPRLNKFLANAKQWASQTST